MKRGIILALFALCLSGYGQAQVAVRIADTASKQVISKNLYGQFAEHLGSCIYGGLWVGKDSPIPNTNGYRTDVLEALKKLKVPVMRWPGGCFADEYHWMDGIGDPNKRPKMVNNWWGGAVENNSFGTHEFLNLCEMLGCEPYISGNVGSGTVEELNKWVEYMTSAGDSPMANLRRQNGREKPWKVKFLGVGNESWGCGGNMRPEYYADLYRRYATYCRDYDGNRLYKIASGASDYDYNWTEVLMKQIGDRMNGISLHYYTVTGWSGSKGSATTFTPNDYYWTVNKCSEIEGVIQKHLAIMDKYDAQKKVGLLVDEWGTWWDTEPNGTPLYQQNTMRDAMVAALTLNIFNRYSDRVKMANIAQVVNVLQSMILTKDSKMVLTPTYHVFEMYNVHQDARYIPLTVEVGKVKTASGAEIPAVSASASKDAAGNINITMANIDLDKSQEVTIALPFAAKSASGRILTSKNITDYNSYDNAEVVKPTPFQKIKLGKGTVTFTLPAKSIVAVTLR
ncbi:alpha-L-arabinofuranosidase C-terminal domain-containing protein [uncultured Acetobacteroides sp.]|uniref:alpha-N-arabinofuranosidase n=1 Tax=uncultured Acetobacteroides sp. TaxID=1760811 RepID=UPI0029F5AE6E|nr:alpha-L-arabinofuranosidase C-terminal domain-containing protein [uncultured Acetobacteroides sp.]